MRGTVKQGGGDPTPGGGNVKEEGGLKSGGRRTKANNNNNTNTAPSGGGGGQTGSIKQEMKQETVVKQEHCIKQEPGLDDQATVPSPAVNGEDISKPVATPTAAANFLSNDSKVSLI